MADDLGHAQVLIPPPLIFVAFLGAALALHWAFPLPIPRLDFLSEVGGILILAGLFLGAWAVRLMAKAHTSVDPQRPTTVLMTDGPYSRSRNPIYLGFLMIYLGFTLLAGTLWGVLLSPILLLTVTRAVVRAEESYLQFKFGSRYSQYKSRVRQWL